MQTYHATVQTHFVTKVIESDMFEVDPGIPREMARQTPIQARIKAAAGSVGTVVGAPVEGSVIPTFTEKSDDSNVCRTIRLKNIFVPKSSTAEGKEAMHSLKQLIEGKRVIFNFHPQSISNDNDNVGAYVWRFPDNAFVNAIMVYNGHAEWKSPPVQVNMPPYLPPRVSRI